METFLEKDEWKFVTLEFGVQCVMICGALKMPRWFAGNCSYQSQVSICPNLTSSLCTFLISDYEVYKKFKRFALSSLCGLWVRLNVLALLFLDVIAISNARFGAGSGQIWLDNVACTGSENRLADCPANTLGAHNCAHSEDAGVRCTSKIFIPELLIERHFKYS